MDKVVAGFHDFPGMSGGGEVVMGGRLGGALAASQGVCLGGSWRVRPLSETYRRVRLLTQ